MGNVGQFDSGGTSGFAFLGDRTAAEAFLVHLGDHAQHALGPFTLTLRQRGHLRHFGRDEQHRRSIFARSDAGTAADARRGVHRIFLLLPRHGNRVAIRRSAGVHRDVTARLNDAVKRRTIDHQVAHHGEGIRTPWFDDQQVAIFESSHVQLAGCRPVIRSVRLTVDHHATGATDSFAAVVIERDRFFPLGD